MSILVSNLGFPRIGTRRELKKALEEFWSGQISAEVLQTRAKALRAGAWERQKSAGIDVIPSNDFSLYDHVLDTSVMVGAVPEHYLMPKGPVALDTYFAMARGTRGRSGCDLHAQEMTKWFDTNYHYMVPQFLADQDFEQCTTKPLDEFREARALGIATRPVLVGPVTFLLLGKPAGEKFDTLRLLPALLPVYASVLKQLAAEGADWVQIDEPCLVQDLSDAAKEALRFAYQTLAAEVPQVKLMLTTYFGGLGDNLETALALPVAGLHLDLVRALDQLDSVLAKAPEDLTLSLGLVDGRNIWRSDLCAKLETAEKVLAKRKPEKVMLAPSCSLIHSPIDLELETGLDPDLKSWLAFSVQKLDELSILGRALNEGRGAVADALEASSQAAAKRKTSPKIHNAAVKARLEEVTPQMTARASAYPERRKAQKAYLGLPLYPTTTIGSFPQTKVVREARASHAKGMLDDAAYDEFLRRETEACVRWQEEAGIDVLVHGEFERNDMVQYFGEQLSGFAFTKHAWVQSYGSRYVRPPVIFGDVSRPKPMTVKWTRYAQSLTKKPMKGMLTGPVTILQWSFVRDDLPRDAVCAQIALALRDELADLEAAGISVIQVDEPAVREGLPLRRKDWVLYLAWAVAAFRLATSGVADATQIHTHMCYAEFNDIIEAIAAMDADVISIETARSKMELLDAFAEFHYPNEIGPGVYDIHSPRTPSVEEIVALLKKAGERLPAEQIWVNPDCGLKTRSWDETRPALLNMVAAAKKMRG
ncbi:5-methyltetrahydropteroyltriglutamate--homocysteine methyltransferase [Rhizomicrobium palustre]|uniref:5-methyltetrahydropteroyltriglutamate--homocysteine methyltransferase n=1 Tax=Rhizomicrobium palustre TaxID=189966 RepID=A0A846N016_9PROT|nr:5-methyltetrahydropteroyltriglutamate--homocysteine S-methyltransferase [Rhizomicrobium palustre]NIK88835.1 5-methyltetrahydropteroyltriglutamate--homocysteine methyltransferase [Rhizomicrobium palustre]